MGWYPFKKKAHLPDVMSYTIECAECGVPCEQTVHTDYRGGMATTWVTHDPYSGIPATPVLESPDKVSQSTSVQRLKEI